MRNLQARLPSWVTDWLEIIIPAGQILLILAVAWFLQRMLRRLVARASAHYELPHELLVPVNGAIRWFILAGALLLCLERMGVSATVLWTAFTGFATVAAVAFFAAWSVLSNLFCALLILTVGPFRLGDYIEVLDTAEKPGAKGRVVDINLLYTTLEEVHPDSNTVSVKLQIPNALIFQRIVRRWRPDEHTPPSFAPSAAPASAPQPAVASTPRP